MNSEERDEFNNNINSLPSFKITHHNFLSVPNKDMSRRRNSLANGQIQLGLIPRIKVSLAPELKSSRGPDEDLHPPIDEHSEQDHKSSRALDLPHNSKLFRRNSLPDSEYLRKRSSSASISPFFVESKRRISQVSNVVTQHFQSTIGWSLKSHTEIARQSRCLAAKYIRWKLRKVGLFHKRLQLQRLRSVGNLNDEHDVYINEIAIELKCLIQELERNHPKVFASVIANAGDVMLKNVHALKRVHRLIGSFIFDNSSSSTSSNQTSNTIGSELNNNQSGQFNWAQVAAFYAVTGALAVDSVRSGHPEYVLPLIDSLTKFISKQVAPWISQVGGWESLINKYREQDEWKTTLKVTVLSLLTIFISILLYFLM